MLKKLQSVTVLNTVEFVSRQSSNFITPEKLWKSSYRYIYPVAVGFEFHIKHVYTNQMVDDFWNCWRVDFNIHSYGEYLVNDKWFLGGFPLIH